VLIAVFVMCDGFQVQKE